MSISFKLRMLTLTTLLISFNGSTLDTTKDSLYYDRKQDYDPRDHEEDHNQYTMPITKVGERNSRQDRMPYVYTKDIQYGNDRLHNVYGDNSEHVRKKRDYNADDVEYNSDISTMLHHSGLCELHRIVHTIELDGCLPRRILSSACHGTCHSYTQIHPSRGSELQHHCTCCQAESSSNVQVNLFCRDSNRHGKLRQVTLPLTVPNSCRCRPCTMEALHDIVAEEYRQYPEIRRLWKNED